MRYRPLFWYATSPPYFSNRHYQQSQNKKAVCTFSINKFHPDKWAATTTDVMKTVRTWNNLAPPEKKDVLPDPHKRKQSVQWTREAEAVLVKLRQDTTMSNREIAVAMNTMGRGSLIDPRNRMFSKRDIQRQLKKLFPAEMDVTHTLCALKEMRSQKGWETLRYKPEWTHTEAGVTIKSLTIELPHAKELVKHFGNVIHIDCTYGTLIYGHKVLCDIAP